ncbi:hypothetical protein M378DRAFT_159270 [Amanita muscaria Koide BX008]|uniref:Mediator of RNA polymerase II transcription subunit 25 n=1 Tax=Amanita muscaria (strain Koide BX008) TaxID=946122 RepID=A0A0C2XDA8_AMAMK|nr:hypothetical protein M378DRAFT_159270 [Amanita muscaria Koide BX008]
MAQESGQEAILAIAFIVESSRPVYHQWGIIFKDYLTNIMRRLADTYSGARMKVAFVTYGLADMLQSPILCKRFFVDHLTVFKEMTESPGKLAFGQANTGGDKGMAALEGHVAALELFDVLNEPSQTKRGRVLSNFVIHVAACPPDVSRHPQWNNLTSLDNTTWETLPQEYQKRNISYNAIILNNQLHQHLSLHSAIQQRHTGSSLWFSVRATHAVLLSGIPAAESKITPTKRSSDLEKTPESKRPRLSQNNPETPSQINRAIPERQEKGELAQPAPIPTASAQQGFVAQFLSRVRIMEDNIRALEAKISDAKLADNAQLVDQLSSECRQKKEVLTNFQRRVFEHVQALKASQSGSGIGSGNPTVTPSQQGNPSAPPTNIQQKQMGGPGPSSHNQSNDLLLPYSHMSDNAEGSSSSRDHMFSDATVKPQPKWPSEQEHLIRSMPGTVMHSNASPVSAHLPSGNPTQGQSVMNSTIVWQGQFIWNGHGSAGKKECRARVVAHSPHVAECRADTWPPQLTLVPTPEPAVSLVELREWITRFKPVICRFQPKTEPGDLMNEQYYKSLIQLLVAKRVFAVAGWTLPSGAQENNVLVFPMNEQVLLGAFFPVTGIPEMPKPRSTGIQTSRQGSEVLAQLQRLPPEHRDYMIARLLQQRSNPYPTGNLHAHSSVVPGHPQTMHARTGQNLTQTQHINSERPGFNSQESSLLPLGGNPGMESVQFSEVQQQLSHINTIDHGDRGR